MEAAKKSSLRTAESLGKVTYETKPNVSNVVAGFILGVGLVAGGLLLTAYMMRQMFLPGGIPPQGAFNWAGAIVIALLGLALAAGGVLVVIFAKSLVGFRICVCADGFWFTRGNQPSVFAWDEIVLIKESVSEERLPLVKGAARHLMPTKTTRTYTVVRCDGEEFYFDENMIQHTSLLAGPLATAAKARGIKWQTVEESV